MGSPVPAGAKLDRYGLNPSYRCSISELVYVFQIRTYRPFFTGWQPTSPYAPDADLICK
jgi:hypothetical protein